jgi:small subunit ribosomal protein S10e
VIKACQSLTSKGFLKTQFAWQYYYYTLTPEGLDYLREWLHLPAEVVPQTHVKQQRAHAPPRGMLGGDDRDRRGYRRRDQGDGKETGAPGDWAPSFRSGFGMVPSLTCFLRANKAQVVLGVERAVARLLHPDL